MGQMVRPKKEWVCKNCGFKYIKWAGQCYRGCNFTGTLEERILINNSKKNNNGNATKKLIRRAKDSEREIAKRMISADGADPAYRNIASSTGRIGFITGMRVDAISRNYVTENKNRKMPTWVIKAWILINQRSVDFNKNALLHIDPPNMPKEIKIQGSTQRLGTMAIITQDRHEELIKNEKILQALLKEVDTKEQLKDLKNLYFYLLSDKALN